METDGSRVAWIDFLQLRWSDGLVQKIEKTKELSADPRSCASTGRQRRRSNEGESGEYPKGG